MAMIFGNSNSSSSSSSSKNSNIKGITTTKGKGGKDTTDSIVPVDPYKHKRQYESWYCHCCGLENFKAVEVDEEKWARIREGITEDMIPLPNCRVCGRRKDYAVSKFPLAIHGQGGSLFRPEQVKAVIENITDVDSNNWLALHHACAMANVPLAKLLLEEAERFAEDGGAFSGWAVEAITEHGYTALHLAIYSGSMEIVKLLLQYKSKVNVKTLYEKKTPLIMAVEGPYPTIIKMLIDAGATVNDSDTMERTPLHVAAGLVNDRADIAVTLLKAGADHKKMDVHGWTPRMVAEFNDNRIFQELLVREDMPEKVASLRELPKANYHSKLWSEVVDVHRVRRQEAADAKAKAAQLVIDVQKARDKIDRLRLLDKQKALEQEAIKEAQLIEARLRTASRMNELHNNSRPISPDTNNKTTNVIIDHGFSRPTSAVPTTNYNNTNIIKTNTITIIPSKLLTSTANNVINNTTSTLTISNLRSHKAIMRAKDDDENSDISELSK